MNRLLALFTAALVLLSVAYTAYAQVQESSGGQIRCGVDVLKLYVRDNTIFSEIKNTGNVRETVKYTISVNSQTVETNSITLEPGQIRTVSVDYNFASGTHTINIVATSFSQLLPGGTQCSRFDSETIIYSVPPNTCSNPFGKDGDKVCNFNFNQFFVCDSGTWRPTGEQCGNACFPGYTGDFRCSGDWLQRAYQNPDCSINWQNYQFCNQGCSFDRCNSYPPFECRQYQYTACYGGNLWWYDSCGNRQNVYQYCGNGCSGNQCLSQPSQNAYTACYSGNLWWYDAYGNRQSIYQYCANGCSGNQCISQTTSCSLLVDRFDYSSNVVEGQNAFATIGVINSGNREETIRLTLFVGGVEKGADSRLVSPGTSWIRTFNYYPAAGTHRVTIIIESSCGSTASKTAEVTVQKTVMNDRICNNNGVCESWEDYNSCPRDCPTTTPVTTSVTVSPDSFDIGLYKSKAIAIDIKSSITQKFSISITGVPETWLNYPKEVELVAGETKSVFVYITPQDLGNKNLIVSVKALGENRDFGDTVNAFVAPVGLSDGQAQPTDGITGFVTVFTNPWVWLVILVVIIVLLVIFGFYRMREREVKVY